jgi:CDGSH-type Zn-finger protein/ferredoxin
MADRDTKRQNAAPRKQEPVSIESGRQPGIDPSPNGPLIVTGVEKLTNSRGEALPTSPRMELCRCGGSMNKPFCDGTHKRRGFASERDPDHAPDRAVDYPGARITVHFNERQCSGAGECARGLPSVFRDRDVVRIVLGKPWIQPDREDAERIVEVIRRCPSGALRYTRGDEPGPDHREPPGILIRQNGPYEVRGKIPLRTAFWHEGATRQIYALCRCGASKNKPFCDGSHRRTRFRDEKN